MLQIVVSPTLPNQPPTAPLSPSSELDTGTPHQFLWSPKPFPTLTLPEGTASRIDDTIVFLLQEGPLA